MVQLPGEDDLHNFLIAKHLVLVRTRSPFGYVYRVIHQPPGLPIHSEIGTIIIKKEEAELADKLAGLIQKRVTELIKPITDVL